MFKCLSLGGTLTQITILSLDGVPLTGLVGTPVFHSWANGKERRLRRDTSQRLKSLLGFIHSFVKVIDAVMLLDQGVSWNPST